MSGQVEGLSVLETELWWGGQDGTSAWDHGG